MKKLLAFIGILLSSAAMAMPAPLTLDFKFSNLPNNFQDFVWVYESVNDKGTEPFWINLLGNHVFESKTGISAVKSNGFQYHAELGGKIFSAENQETVNSYVEFGVLKAPSKPLCSLERQVTSNKATVYLSFEQVYIYNMPSQSYYLFCEVQ